MDKNETDTGETTPPSTATGDDSSSKPKQNAPQAKGTMHVKVYSPFKVYFDADAQSVSAVNDTGPFDILPQHHNFMTLLQPCEVVVRTTRGEQKIKIAKGIMHVKADRAIIFLDV